MYFNSKTSILLILDWHTIFIYPLYYKILFAADCLYLNQVINKLILFELRDKL